MSSRAGMPHLGMACVRGAEAFCASRPRACAAAHRLAVCRKKMFALLDLCVSSLCRGHANLLCIVPILTDDPRRESGCKCFTSFLHCIKFRICRTPHSLGAISGPNNDWSFCNSLLGLSNIFHGRWPTSARADIAQTILWLIIRRWGLAPVALRGLGGEVSVNTLCPASHVDGLPRPNK